MAKKLLEDPLYTFTDEGQTLIGVYEGFEICHPKGRTAKMYSVTDSDGTVQRFFGCYILDKKLPRIPSGTEVEITFRGWQGDTGNPYKAFDVAYDEDVVVLAKPVTTPNIERERELDEDRA